MAFTETFTFQPMAPFSLNLSAEIFSSGDKKVRGYGSGEFCQVLKIGEGLVYCRVTQQGKIEQPKLTVKLTSNKPIRAEIKRSVQEALSYIFNLNFRLADFYEAIADDAVMRRITVQLHGFKYPTTASVFESLVDSIVEQQINIKVARVIEERLAKKFGDQLQLDNETYYVFPTPQRIGAVSINDIRLCGLSQRKAEYIYNAAHLIVNGELDLEKLKLQPDAQEIIAQLDEIKGIGVWTAELTMFRGMQRYDALPADDFGIRRVISAYYRSGKPIKAAEAREVAEAWGRWKGLAAFYLMLAEVKGITV